MPVKEFLTVAQTAELTGYTVQHTRRLARTGRLPAIKPGRDWLIERKAAMTRQPAKSPPVTGAGGARFGQLQPSPAHGFPDAGGRGNLAVTAPSRRAPSKNENNVSQARTPVVPVVFGTITGRAACDTGVRGTIATLRISAIFSDLDGRHIAELGRLAQPRRLRARQSLFLEGDPVECCYVVADGLIKMLKHTSSGKDFISDIHGPGETIGFTRLFDGKPHFSSAKAIVDTDVMAIARSDFISFLYSFPEAGFKIMVRMVEIASKRRTSATVRLSEQSAEPADYRLARVLTTLWSKLGATIPLTRYEIAEMAGTTTETAARFVSRLSRMGALQSFREKVIVVDENRLRHLARIPCDLPKA